MSPRDAEAIVVGGGPAGAAAAYFLARAGIEVVLCDMARFPRDKPCAEYLSPQASRILDAMGVLPAIEGLGAAQLAGMQIHAPNGELFTGRFAADHGYRGFRDRGLALPRLLLDATLLDAARAAGVRVIEQAQVTDLLYNGSRVSGVEVRTTGQSERRSFRAPLVIGADGLRSRVGRRLNLVRRGRWPQRIAMVAHFRNITGVGALGEMHVFADGYLGLADVGHGITNVALVVPSGWAKRHGAPPEEMFAQWLPNKPSLSPRFANARMTRDFIATGPFNSGARTAWHPGAVLVGDAADFFDPFTGEGIYSALRGAELLLPYAFEAARGDSARKADVALAAYDRCRRNEFAAKWKVERLIGAAVSSPALFNFVARRLAQRSDLADLLVGVAGDFVPARRVLHPGFILSLLIGASHLRQSAVTPSERTTI